MALTGITGVILTNVEKDILALALMMGRESPSLQCGVPQGSVLDHLLIMLYINEISTVLLENAMARAIETSIHGYSDHLQLFTSCTITSLDPAVSELAA